MRKFLLIIILSCPLLEPDLIAQEIKDCLEIRVEVKVENAASGLSNGKITLNFHSGLDYKEFKLFLFAEKRSNNKLDFTATEINDLPKGNYTLIIQGKDEGKFCQKQFKLKLD